MNQFQVLSKSKSDMWRLCLDNGKIQIPVSNFFNDSGRVDAFEEDSRVYYNALEELLEVLNVPQVPEALVGWLTDFLEVHPGTF